MNCPIDIAENEGMPARAPRFCLCLLPGVVPGKLIMSFDPDSTEEDQWYTMVEMNRWINQQLDIMEENPAETSRV